MSDDGFRGMFGMYNNMYKYKCILTGSLTHEAMDQIQSITEHRWSWLVKGSVDFPTCELYFEDLHDMCQVKLSMGAEQ